MIIAVSGDYGVQWNPNWTVKTYGDPAQAAKDQAYFTTCFAKASVKPARWFRHDQGPELVAAIRALPAAEKLTLIGFSWGGDAAIVAAAECGRPVDCLVLLSPCHKKGTGAFALPASVQRAYCVYRTGCKAIQEFPIGVAACPFVNRKYNPPAGKGEADQHGHCVREPAEWAALVRATGGGV